MYNHKCIITNVYSQMYNHKCIITNVYKEIYPVHFLCFSAPSIFPLLYNIVKPFLSEATKKKIKVLGSK